MDASPPKRSSCCLRYLAPPSIAWAGSLGSYAERGGRARHQLGQALRAGAASARTALKLDSWRIRPLSSAGSMPYLVAAAVICASYCVAVPAAERGRDRGGGSGRRRAGLRAGKLGREARRRRRRALPVEGRDLLLDLSNARADQLDAHAALRRAWARRPISSSSAFSRPLASLAMGLALAGLELVEHLARAAGLRSARRGGAAARCHSCSSAAAASARSLRRRSTHAWRETSAAPVSGPKPCAIGPLTGRRADAPRRHAAPPRRARAR